MAKQFSITKGFNKSIKNKNLRLVRLTLGDLCFVDRKHLSAMICAMKYAEKIIGDELWEKYRKFAGSELVSTQNKEFTEDDFEEAVALFANNFCKERLEDVKKLSKIVYGNRNISPMFDISKPVIVEGEEESSDNNSTNNDNWFKRKMNSLRKVFDSVVNKVKRFGQRVKNYFDRQAEKNTIVGKLYSMFKSLAHRIQSALSKLINICKNAINGKGNEQVKQKIQQGIEQTDKGLSQLDDIATKLDDEIKD